MKIAVDTWSRTLLPPHFEAITNCWNEALLKAPMSERVKLVNFLICLHSRFPGWKGMYNVGHMALPTIFLQYYLGTSSSRSFRKKITFLTDETSRQSPYILKWWVSRDIFWTRIFTFVVGTQLQLDYP